MIDQSILRQVKEYALDMDWNVAFGGKAHGNQHLSRVVTIAQFLAEKEGARREICEAGAWLHDIGLIAGNDNNPATIRAIVEEYLASLVLHDEYKRRIAECAETHEGVSVAVSLEAKIVHDADALDKMGLLGVIRHTWKIVNLINPGASSREVFSQVQRHLQERREKLYTTTAKKLVRELNKAVRQFFEDSLNAMEIIEMIIQCGKKDIISDDIAKRLLLKTDNRSLMSQLSISHEILQWWYEQDNTGDEDGDR